MLCRRGGGELTGPQGFVESVVSTTFCNDVSKFPGAIVNVIKVPRYTNSPNALNSSPSMLVDELA